MLANDIVKEWIDFASKDLESAKHLFNTMHPQPFEIICYHCQQSAEKIIKAIHISQNKPLVKTHDLGFLIDTINSPVPQEIIQDCDALNIYGIKARYPLMLDLNIQHCEKALHNAEIFFLGV